MVMKILNWLSGLVPERYSVGVAIKKVVQFVGKLVASVMAGKYLAGKVTPDQATQIQLGVTTAVGASLEAFHDFLKVKFPNVRWL